MRNFKIFHLERVPGLVFFKNIWLLSKNFQLVISFLNVFVTKSVGNRFHELSLGRNDRLGLGTSKIEVLAKNTKKKQGKSMIFPVFPVFFSEFLAKTSIFEFPKTSIFEFPRPRRSFLPSESSWNLFPTDFVTKTFKKPIKHWKCFDKNYIQCASR